MLPEVKAKIALLDAAEFREIAASLDTLDDIRKLLAESINDEDTPLTIREGGIIKDGYNTQIDELRSIKKNGSGYVKEIEAREKEKTGIKNMRVGYNRVFGYYLEVAKSQIDLVPETYIRKQTLANCERYITEELKELEATILGATDKLAAMEYLSLIHI